MNASSICEFASEMFKLWNSQRACPEYMTLKYAGLWPQQNSLHKAGPLVGGSHTKFIKITSQWKEKTHFWYRFTYMKNEFSYHRFFQVECSINNDENELNKEKYKEGYRYPILLYVILYSPILWWSEWAKWKHLQQQINICRL